MQFNNEITILLKKASKHTNNNVRLLALILGYNYNTLHKETQKTKPSKKIIKILNDFIEYNELEIKRQTLLKECNLYFKERLSKNYKMRLEALDIIDEISFLEDTLMRINHLIEKF